MPSKLEQLKAMTQVVGGQVEVFTGDISEATGFMESGDLRVLAVLADERLPRQVRQHPHRQGAGHRRGWSQLARFLHAQGRR